MEGAAVQKARFLFFFFFPFEEFSCLHPYSWQGTGSRPFYLFIFYIELQLGKGCLASIQGHKLIKHGYSQGLALDWRAG